MTSEQNRSDPSEGGQVSEAANLRGRMDEAEIQQDEGVPPAEDAEQEDQSRIEAEISPDDPQADDVDEAVDRAVGRDQV